MAPQHRIPASLFCPAKVNSLATASQESACKGVRTMQSPTLRGLPASGDLAGLSVTDMIRTSKESEGLYISNIFMTCLINVDENCLALRKLEVS